jgi:hypothetical protein
MAFPLQRGITPPEIEFLSEMELVTVVPRQRLEGLELLSVSGICTPPSICPSPAELRDFGDLHSSLAHLYLRYQRGETDVTICRVQQKDYYRRSAQHSLSGSRSY